jgi:hypothetical protein
MQSVSDGPGPGARRVIERRLNGKAVLRVD